MTPFDATTYLREIARGKHGARDLTREQARILFTAVFAGEVHDLALGALLVALRIKGETVDELAGMMEALAPHVMALRLPARRTLALLVPTYNGARKLPNLVPLLALLLARENVPVVVHGMSQEQRRVGTFEILELLGHRPVGTMVEAGNRLERHHLAVVPLSILSPALARLLDVRLTVGVRNSGHTLAKLLLPNGIGPAQAARLIAVTHPDFQALLRDYFAGTPGNVFLMRGVEGEPVVRLHSPQPMELIGMDGHAVPVLVEDGEPDYPLPARDAHATAQWTASVLEGRERVPRALAGQVAQLAGQCRKGAATPSLRLISSK
jgi:anthranilate phosphoribosyltransferase